MSRRRRDGVLHPGDEEFLSGLKEAELVERTPRGTWGLYLMLTVVVVGLVWAGFARVDEITRAEGRVIPDGREQEIASLEGGLLGELLVREGQLVEAGQALARLDPTRVEAQQNEGEARRLALRGTLARLTAEATGQALVFDDELEAQPQVITGERAAFMTRRQALDEAIEVNRRSLGLLRRELEMAQRMAARGLMSEVEVMRLRRQANDFELQIQDRVNRFRQEASLEAVKVRNELAQLDEQMVVKQDVLQRTSIKSPIRGVIKHIKMATIGGVVQPGNDMLEIVPLDDSLLIEAKVRPQDVAFLHPGQKAMVKFSAYDYTIYGGLKANLELISADTITDEEGNSFYLIQVRTDKSHLGSEEHPLLIIPGMVATVDIITDKKSVLDYLLKPVLKARAEALRER